MERAPIGRFGSVRRGALPLCCPPIRVALGPQRQRPAGAPSRDNRFPTLGAAHGDRGYLMRAASHDDQLPAPSASSNGKVCQSEVQAHSRATAALRAATRRRSAAKMPAARRTAKRVVAAAASAQVKTRGTLHACRVRWGLE